MFRLGRFFATALPRLTVACYRAALYLLLATCRWRIHNLSAFHTAATRPCLLVLWHDRLLLTAPLLCRYAPHLSYVAVVSGSREGDLLATLAASYPQGRALSIPSECRPVALKAIIETLQQRRDVVIVTPDGPRGPRHHLKPGVALAALRSDATVIPVTWRASRSWELPTWDRLALPKPFSKIDVFFGDGLSFTADMPLPAISAAILETMTKL